MCAIIYKEHFIINIKTDKDLYSFTGYHQQDVIMEKMEQNLHTAESE